VVGGVVSIAVDARAYAVLPDLSDQQNPGQRLGCRLGAVEDAVFMLAADRTVAFERIVRVVVRCFPLQHGYPYPVILDSFRCTAQDLARYRLQSESMWLRREDDSEDPGTWHLVRTIRDTCFRSIYDPGLQGIKLLTVSATPEG